MGILTRMKSLPHALASASALIAMLVVAFLLMYEMDFWSIRCPGTEICNPSLLPHFFAIGICTLLSLGAFHYLRRAAIVPLVVVWAVILCAYLADPLSLLVPSVRPMYYGAGSDRVGLGQVILDIAQMEYLLLSTPFGVLLLVGSLLAGAAWPLSRNRVVAP